MRLRRIADEADLPIIIHVQETRLQVLTGNLFFGRTMIEHLDKLEFLRPGVSLVHGVWLSPREIDILARSGATVQHNPTSNMSLGSGLCPVRELLQAGVNVSLGTDACGSSFSISMLKALNNTALVQNLRRPKHEQWISAKEVWTAATASGAKALGPDGPVHARGYVDRLDQVLFNAPRPGPHGAQVEGRWLPTCVSTNPVPRKFPAA